MSRRADRQGETPEVRTRMLEDDLDRAESDIVVAKRELEGKVEHAKQNASMALQGVKLDLSTRLATLEAKVDKGFEECEGRDNKTRTLLTGLLISIVTLCVTVTVGLLITVGGG